MNVSEIITELADRPAKISLKKDRGGNVFKILNSELGLEILLNRMNGTDVGIIFSVNGSTHLTNKGNQYEILSTVHDALKRYLPEFLKPDDSSVSFIADRSESSRVKLYQRIASKYITPILGSDWNFVPQVYADYHYFVWERLGS